MAPCCARFRSVSAATGVMPVRTETTALHISSAPVLLNTTLSPFQSTQQITSSWLLNTAKMLSGVTEGKISTQTSCSNKPKRQKS